MLSSTHYRHKSFCFTTWIIWFGFTFGMLFLPEKFKIAVRQDNVAFFVGIVIFVCWSLFLSNHMKNYVEGCASMFLCRIKPLWVFLLWVLWVLKRFRCWNINAVTVVVDLVLVIETQYFVLRYFSIKINRPWFSL